MTDAALPLAAAGAAAHAAERTSTGLNSRKLLFWSFIGSECMFFGSLIATYMVYRGRDTTGPFPHDVFDIPLTSYSALILLVSSLTMVLALSAVQRGDRRRAPLWLAATALLGMHFLANQAWEFTHFVEKGLKLQTNLFSCSFYVLTGFHGTHVLVGTIWLWTLFTLAVRGKLPPGRSLDVEVAGLYWHFVDVVWIAIFTLVYLIH